MTVCKIITSFLSVVLCLCGCHSRDTLESERPKDQNEPFRPLPVADLPSMAVLIEGGSAQVIANGLGVPWPSPQDATALPEYRTHSSPANAIVRLGETDMTVLYAHRTRFDFIRETIQRCKDQHIAFCLLDRPGPFIGWVITIDCSSIPNIAQDMRQEYEGGNFGELNQQKFNGTDVCYFRREKDPRDHNPFLAQSTRPDGMPFWTHEASLGLMLEFRSFFLKDDWLVLTNDLQCSKDVIENWSLGKAIRRDSISFRRQPPSPKHPETLSVDVYPEKFAQVCTDLLAPERDYPSQLEPTMTQGIAFGLSTLGTHFERIQGVFEVDDHGPAFGTINFEFPKEGHRGGLAQTSAPPALSVFPKTILKGSREGLAQWSAILRTFDCIPKTAGVAGIFDDRWHTTLSMSWNTDVGIPAFFELLDSFVGNSQADRVLSAVLGLNSENEDKPSTLMLRALSGTIDVGWQTDSTWVVRLGIRDAEAAQILVDAISRSIPRESNEPKTAYAPSYGGVFLVGANDGAIPARDELLTPVGRIAILMREGFIWLSSNSEIIESLSQDASRAPHTFAELTGTEVSPASTHAYAIGRFLRRPAITSMSPQVPTAQFGPIWDFQLPDAQSNAPIRQSFPPTFSHPRPILPDGQSNAPGYSQPHEERIPQTEPTPNEKPAQPDHHFEYAWQVEPSDTGLLLRVHRRERPAVEAVVPGELKERPFVPGTTSLGRITR